MLVVLLSAKMVKECKCSMARTAWIAVAMLVLGLKARVGAYNYGVVRLVVEPSHSCTSLAHSAIALDHCPLVAAAKAFVCSQKSILIVRICYVGSIQLPQNRWRRTALSGALRC